MFKFKLSVHFVHIERQTRLTQLKFAWVSIYIFLFQVLGIHANFHIGVFWSDAYVEFWQVKLDRYYICILNWTCRGCAVDVCMYFLLWYNLSILYVFDTPPVIYTWYSHKITCMKLYDVHWINLLVLSWLLRLYHQSWLSFLHVEPFLPRLSRLLAAHLPDEVLAVFASQFVITDLLLR